MCPTKQTLEKVYFYQDRVKKRIAKKKKKKTKNKHTYVNTKKKKNSKQAHLCLFSVIAVSQYLCYTTYCYHKISQQAYY